jgi:hypothetical protein
MLQESWKAADPACPPGAANWKSGRSWPMVWVWFVVYSILGNIGTVAISFGVAFDPDSLGGDLDVRPEAFDERGSLLYLQPLLAIAGAVAWFLVVRGLTRRHQELTGEASAR